jgi:hypothetical protein
VPDDLKQVFVLNHAYELPFGARRRYLSTAGSPMSWAIWDLHGIWSAKSGQRFNATLATAVSNTPGGGGGRPNRPADGNLPSGQGTINHLFNVSAFAVPAQFTFGNAGAGILVGPGYLSISAFTVISPSGDG